MVCATYGEKGSGHLEKPVTKTQLKKIRKKELDNACHHLKVKKLHCLHLPDGGLADHKDEFYKESLVIAKRFTPEYVLGFGPDGITGHNDHVAAFLVAKKVAKFLKLPYYAFAFSPRVVRNAHSWLIPRRRAKHYRTKLVLPQPNVKVAINAKDKLEALSCHTSQLDQGSAFAGFPKYAVAETLAADYFVEH